MGACQDESAKARIQLAFNLTSFENDILILFFFSFLVEWEVESYVFRPKSWLSVSDIWLAILTFAICWVEIFTKGSWKDGWSVSAK